MHEPLSPGVRELRRYRNASYVLVECSHDLGFRRTHDGGMGRCCRICFGDAVSTGGYTLPVKMLVLIKQPPEEIVIPKSLVQETLF